MPTRQRRALIISSTAATHAAVTGKLSGSRKVKHRAGISYIEDGSTIPNWNVAAVHVGKRTSVTRLKEFVSDISPNLIIYVSQAAGLRDVLPGDVVVAASLNERNDANSAPKENWRITRLDGRFIDHARRTQSDPELLKRIRAVASHPKVVVAPVWVSSSLIVSGDIPGMRFRAHEFRDAVAVVSPVLHVELLQDHSTHTACVLGIADLADNEKTSDASLVANNAASTSFYLLSTFGETKRDATLPFSPGSANDEAHLEAQIVERLRELTPLSKAHFAARLASRIIAVFGQGRNEEFAGHLDTLTRVVKFAESVDAPPSAEVNLVISQARAARDGLEILSNRHANRATRSNAEEDDSEADFHRGIATTASVLATAAKCAELAIRSFKDHPAEIVPALAETVLQLNRMAPDVARASTSELFDGTASADAGVAKRPLTDAASPPHDASLDSGAGFRYALRAAPEEACLNSQFYIDVLKTVLDGTEEEICLALFGFWGRGKTYLMMLLGDELRKEGRQAIFFSAWKYPSIPQVWVHLYETVAEQLSASWWPTRLAVSVRAALHRHGIWPLFFILVSFSAAITPFWQYEQAARSWLPVLGLFGLFFILKLYFGVNKTGRQLIRQYVLLPRHTEQLGLQAVIGRDLRALLRAWVSPDANQLHDAFQRLVGMISECVKAFRLGQKNSLLRDGSLQELRSLFVSIATDIARRLKAMIFGHAGDIAVYLLASVLVLRALWPHPEVSKPLHLWYIGDIPTYLPWHISWAFCALWSLLAIIMPILIWCVGWERKRLLLTVDDLDRLAAMDMLAVIESLKLLMEESDVNRRLQVVMLVEEDSLRHSVLQKYKSLWLRRKSTDSERDSRRRDRGLKRRHRIWRETLEKLFVAHLRLPALTQREIEEVMRVYASRDRRQREAKDSNALSGQLLSNNREIVRESMDQTARAVGNRREGESRPIPMDVAIGDPSEADVHGAPTSSEVLLTRADEAALVEVSARFVHSKWDIPCGPRSERNFLCRYMIARVMLHKLGAQVRPHQLAHALADAAGYRGDHEHVEKVDPSVAWVLKQLR